MVILCPCVPQAGKKLKVRPTSDQDVGLDTSFRLKSSIPFHSKMSSTFADLLSVYTSWSSLSAYLRSAEGGSLRVDDYSTAENPFALIRYVKGQSDLSKSHVRAFRSVVWDTLENRPASVTPFKSTDGESLPTEGAPAEYRVESFVDGTLIGMWWDKYNRTWRIHTRSTIDGNCRFYSTRSFSDLFYSTVDPSFTTTLNTAHSYSFILSHPENRIVVPVKRASVTCVQEVRITDTGAVEWAKPTVFPPTAFRNARTWNDVIAGLSEWNLRFGHTIQGVHITGTDGRRWKLRTPAYNAVRQMRGNSARRDFLWLSLWKAQQLPAYLGIYPEERTAANRLIDTWKRVTNEVYHTYVDVFKARSLDKSQIPPKYRPFVYGLHNKYMTELKMQGKSVDWRAALEFMNSRDVPQMLYVLNWDLRATTPSGVPFEPASVQTTTVVEPSPSEAYAVPSSITIPADTEPPRPCESNPATCEADGCTTCFFEARGEPVPESRAERLVTIADSQENA